MHNTGTAACERVFSIYKRFRDRGQSPWESYKSVLARTQSAKDIDPALRKMTKEAFEEIYREARLPDGTYDLTKLPSVRQIDEVAGGRTGAAKLHNHHTAIAHILDVLWENWYPGVPLSPNQIDSMPGFLIDSLEHIGGPGQPARSFHQHVRDLITPTQLTEPIDEEVIFEGIQDAYDAIGRPEVGEAAIQWLRSLRPTP